MPEHHGCTEDHGRGVGSVGTHDITGNMTTSRLEQSILLQQKETSRLVGEYVTVRTRPTLQPGTMPGPPTRAAPIFETMAPYKFGITITSNWVGRATSCMELHSCTKAQLARAREGRTHVLSTIMSLYSIPDDLYSSPT